LLSATLLETLAPLVVMHIATAASFARRPSSVTD